MTERAHDRGIFLVPLLVVVLLTKFEGQALSASTPIVGAAIFGLASVTDWLDGYSRGAAGGHLPRADDGSIATSPHVRGVHLARQLGLAPAWIVAVIIGRELAVTGLRGFASTRGLGSALPRWADQDGVAGDRHPALILGQNGAQPFLWLGQVALWVCS
jgi:CDP-diacylglycerol--glycerol-3-phosphate 3-phosphatidyltransferase